MPATVFSRPMTPARTSRYAALASLETAPARRVIACCVRRITPAGTLRARRFFVVLVFFFRAAAIADLLAGRRAAPIEKVARNVPPGGTPETRARMERGREATVLSPHFVERSSENESVAPFRGAPLVSAGSAGPVISRICEPCRGTRTCPVAGSGQIGFSTVTTASSMMTSYL